MTPWAATSERGSSWRATRRNVTTRTTTRMRVAKADVSLSGTVAPAPAGRAGVASTGDVMARPGSSASADGRGSDPCAVSASTAGSDGRAAVHPSRHRSRGATVNAMPVPTPDPTSPPVPVPSATDPTAPATGPPSRLALSRHLGVDASDGVWWPRTTDLGIEVPLLDVAVQERVHARI